MIEPNPELEAFAIKHKQSRALTRPIPSKCDECPEEFPSKFQLEEHVRLLHPKEPPFNDAKREEFLQKLRANVRFFAAAKAVKISPSTIKRAMKIDPAFAEAVELAEEEAAEKAEEKLWEQVEAGNMQAILKVLERRQQKRWGTEPQQINVNVSGTVTHVGALPHQNKIAELAQRARERQALREGTPALANPEIIDAEIVEN